MRKLTMQYKKLASLIMLPLSLITAISAHAAISGITGVSGPSGVVFDLEVSQASINTPDGDSFPIWGYGEVGKAAQYPGPTLIINEGDIVTINLSNKLPNIPGRGAPMPVSMIFPGHAAIVAATSGGTPGLITTESTGPADTVTYQFQANEPGTFMYQSGTRPGLQVEMGLLGAIIVRPAGFKAGDPAGLLPGENHSAYGANTMTDFDHEYLFILTEMDPEIHRDVGWGLVDTINNAVSNPVLWFINGRPGPSTLADDFDPIYPHQPYGSMVQMLPNEKTLMRVIGGGRDLHPFHTHGNNFTMIARDARLLQSVPGMGADLAESDYTLSTEPGSTYDALFTWDGANLGWDVYGHAPDDINIAPLNDFPGPGDIDHNDNGIYEVTALEPEEYAADHGKPLPVVIPELAELTLGAFYSASPFLGGLGTLPPNEGGFNETGGMFYMWHSHTEKELVNNDIFPGGMLTMMVVEPPGVIINYSPF